MTNFDAQNPERNQKQPGKLTQLQRQHESASKKNHSLQQRHHSNINVVEPAFHMQKQ